MNKILLTAAAVVLMQATAFAKVDGIENATLGEHWYGTPRTLESLKGHVVLWENWGYN